MAVWLLMMVEGTGPLDRAVSHALYAGNRPWMRGFGIAMNIAGQWPTVVIGSLGAAGWLLHRRHRGRALLLLVTTMVGRVLIEVQKYGVHRMRPSEEPLLVRVKSLSFPSGHAGNSMILLLAVALIACEPKQRRWAVPLALAGTFLVGISRPMLGVHYPSDVIAGWSFGAAWVLVMVVAAKRWPERRVRR